MVLWKRGENVDRPFMTIGRQFFSAAIVGILLLLPPTPAPSSESVKIVFQSRERRYLLHASSSAQRPAPLVLVFHGGSDTPENMEEISGFSRLADRDGFIVAYPEGVDRAWADGRDTTMVADDVGFTRAMVADIGRRTAVDAKRVYAAGPSNGGIFSLRLGCDAADVFAAVGPVIAGIASQLAPRCRPAEPISIVGIQSIADPMVPFEGGEVGEHNHFARGGRVEGSRATQELWRALDGCNASPVATPLASRVNDGTSVTRREYSGCRSDVNVAWYEIDGGGHRWPPHVLRRPLAERLAQRELGVSSQNIDATETLWTFFSAHPKRGR
jgi:polyhydroxybutyrate depolymerase